MAVLGPLVRRAQHVIGVSQFEANSVAHHMTSTITTGLIVGFAALVCAQVSTMRRKTWVVGVAIGAMLLPWAWAWLTDKPTENYLGPIFESAVNDALALLFGDREPEQAVAVSGHVVPIWERMMALFSLVLTATGLAFGFLRSLRWAGIPLSLLHRPPPLRELRNWRDSMLVLFTLASIGWPVSVILRLTPGGWEVGTRINSFGYLGVGVVCAIGFAQMWSIKMNNVRTAFHAGTACSLLIVAGIVTGDTLVGTYHVAADAASIEPMGIDTAKWARTWLLPDNRFVADRINRLLLTTFGQQQGISSIYDHVEAAPLLFQDDKFSSEQLSVIRTTEADYVLADLRITTQLPAYGSYYEANSPTDTGYSEPPSPSVFLKFNDVPGINRVFDNGYQLIFDVRGLRSAD